MIHKALDAGINLVDTADPRGDAKEVENSLRRLQTDYIDRYQVQRPDPDTDIELTLSALSAPLRRLTLAGSFQLSSSARPMRMPSGPRRKQSR